MKDAEIIPFPTTKIKRHVKTKTPKDYEKQIEDKKFEYIDLLVSQYMTSLFERIANDGIDTSNPLFEKDILFVGESIISALARTYGIPHPLQEFVQESFILPGEEANIDTANTAYDTLPSDTEPKEE